VRQERGSGAFDTAFLLLPLFVTSYNWLLIYKVKSWSYLLPLFFSFFIFFFFSGPSPCFKSFGLWVTFFCRRLGPSSSVDVGPLFPLDPSGLLVVMPFFLFYLRPKRAPGDVENPFFPAPFSLSVPMADWSLWLHVSFGL